MSMPPTPPGWEKFMKGSDARQLERDLAAAQEELERVRDKCNEHYMALAAAQEARDQALAIARELARLATCMDAIPQGSIGTQVDKLRLLEERIARETEFDNAMRNE